MAKRESVFVLRLILSVDGTAYFILVGSHTLISASPQDCKTYSTYFYIGVNIVLAPKVFILVQLIAVVWKSV